MVELVDTLVLGTSAFGRVGSSPSRGTKNNFFILLIFVDSKDFTDKGLKGGETNETS